MEENTTLTGYERFLRGNIFRADLQPGDTLFIPLLYLHKVLILEGGLGINTFFESTDFPDTVACMEVKMRHPIDSWKETSHINAFLREKGLP